MGEKVDPLQNIHGVQNGSQSVEDILRDPIPILRGLVTDEEVHRAVTNSRVTFARCLAKDFFHMGYLAASLDFTLAAYEIDPNNRDVWRDFVIYAPEYLLKVPYTPDKKSLRDSTIYLYGIFDIALKA